MSHKGQKRTIPAYFFTIFFVLMVITKAFPADRHTSYEIGGGLLFGTWFEEERTTRNWGGMATFTLMGKHFGLEALVMGVSRELAFGGSLVFTTNSGAPVSAFFSCGGSTGGFLLGTGLRVRVSNNIYVTGKVHGWITYQGGYSLTLGAIYRFK